MKKLFSLLVLTLLTSAFALDTGALAPATTTVTGHDGKKYSLSQFKGKVVVLEWFNPDCPFVKKHYDKKSSNMQTLQGKYAGSDVVWLTVNSGKKGTLDQKKATAVYKDLGMKSYAILLDNDGKLAKEFGATATPHMFVIDKNGKVAYQGAIDDQDSTDPTNILSAKNYVVNAITQLKAMEKGEKTAKVDPATTRAYGCSISL